MLPNHPPHFSYPSQQQKQLSQHGHQQCLYYTVLIHSQSTHSFGVWSKAGWGVWRGSNDLRLGIHSEEYGIDIILTLKFSIWLSTRVVTKSTLIQFYVSCCHLLQDGQLVLLLIFFNILNEQMFIDCMQRRKGRFENKKAVMCLVLESLNNLDSHI